MFPPWIEIKSGFPEKAPDETRQLLENENITLIEACFLTGNKVVRSKLSQLLQARYTRDGDYLEVLDEENMKYDGHLLAG